MDGRQLHESVELTYQQRTAQSGGGSVMVWGVCSWRNMVPLTRLDTTLTGNRYVSILYDILHPFMSIVHSDGIGEFHQESVTPHTSRIGTEGLHEHSSEFRHFRWPPKSLYMKVSRMSCTVLFSRDIHPLLLLLIYGPPCRIQVSFTSSPTLDINRIHVTSCCGTSACL
ncbi:transposable element Tcb2 transposase [Trichonephila clavipes]|nr:transposable element Tcb2 transposase [Trichonephila clavipes]